MLGPSCAHVQIFPKIATSSVTNAAHMRIMRIMRQGEFIMPKKASDRMQRQIAQGPDGIDEVIKSVSQVDSKQARAWKMEDEIKVKLIRQ